MAVSVVGISATAVPAGNTTTGVSSVTPSLPVGTAVGDRVFIYVASANTSAAAPTSWTQLYRDVQVGVTGTVPGSGVGRRLISCFYRDYDGAWTMPTISTPSATNNSLAACGLTLTKTAAETWDAPTFSSPGHDTTSGTGYSVTIPSFTTVAGAILMTHTGHTAGGATASGQTLTQTGAVFANFVERYDNGTTTGNDVRLVLGTQNVTTGATATLTRTMTLTVAGTGGTCLVQQTTSVTMEPLFTETWTGVTGDPWPAPWVAVGTSGSSTIQTNRGAITAVGAGGGTTAGRAMYWPESRDDTDVTVSFRVSSVTESFVNLMVRSASTRSAGGAGDYSSQGYLLQPNILSGAGTVYLFRSGGGTVVTATSAPMPLTVAANTDYKLRLQAIGGRVRAKLWLASAAEPAAWLLDYTDASPLPAGGYWLGVRNGAAGTDNGYRFDDMAVLVASGAAPPSATSLPLAYTGYARLRPFLVR